MSLVWADGCESVGGWLERKYSVVTQNAPSSVASRTGSGNCYEAGGNTGGGRDFMRRLSASEEHATLTVGFAFRSTALNATTYPEYGAINFASDNGATIHLSLTWSTSPGGRLQIRRFDTLLAQSDPALVMYEFTWYYIEVQATLGDGTSGSVEVRVNEETWISATGIDTKNGGTKTVFDSVYFNGPANVSQLNRFDDIYITNGAGSAPTNGFLGDVKVETLRPNGNGNVSQFTGSDGNSTDNYLLVDESTYSNGDYVHSSNSGDRDLYTFTDLAATAGTVYGVVATAVVNKNDTGSKQAELTARVGGTNYDSAARTLTTTDVGEVQVWEDNPNTSAGWTISDVNGAEFGVQVT